MLVSKEQDIKIEKCLDYFMEKLPEMLKNHEGEFTVFGEKEPLGYYQSFEMASKAAVEKYGLDTVLVQKVSRDYLEFGRYGRPHFIGAGRVL
jgi:hypothetical protein